VEKYGTAGQATGVNTIWRMRFVCWINKATNTHSEYVMHITFYRQHESASKLHYTRNVFLKTLFHTTQYTMSRQNYTVSECSKSLCLFYYTELIDIF